MKLESATAWPRPEFRHIFSGIWVAAAVSENMGKFRPVAPAFRAELKIWAKFRLSMSFLPRDFGDSHHALCSVWPPMALVRPSPAAVGTPHAYSDAAEPISRSTRLH